MADGEWLSVDGMALRSIRYLPSSILAASTSAIGGVRFWALNFELLGLDFPGFQRLCTQNQLAGSRRIAVSKARLISLAIA